MSKRFLMITAFGMALTSPAFAQFPPPGVYLCVDMKGAAFGTLSLAPAGDYDFRSSTAIGGVGQIASSGNSVNAVSGPLADIGLTGSFTSDGGRTSFMFTTNMGSVLCATPAN
jgi:hypothetical protein